MKIGNLVKMYVDFYSPILNEVDKIVVADFSEVISSFDKVVERLNKKVWF